jgi:hypothetical protein
MVEGLHERHTGLTAALGGVFYEAACVCLSRHHGSPVDVEVRRGEGTSVCELAFRAPGERERNAHANVIDATEQGAYGVSMAAVEETESLVVVRRAETLTGADWYVGPPGTPAEDLESCYRLEVSGTDTGSLSTIETRLCQKAQQTRDGKSNLPAIASVVGFKQRVVAIRKVDETK